MAKVDVYISTKEGHLLLHVDVVNNNSEMHDDNLVSGFLSAVNSFAGDMGWPGGVSLIRSGTLECRLSSGEFVFTVLIIENPYLITTNSMLESYVCSIASELCEKFETKYRENLQNARKTNVYCSNDYADFKSEILQTIEKYGVEIKELYFKIILIDAIYGQIPSKWCVPLIHKATEGNDLTNDFFQMIKKYPHFKKIITKNNEMYKPIWDLFGVPIYQIESIKNN